MGRFKFSRKSHRELLGGVNQAWNQLKQFRLLTSLICQILSLLTAGHQFLNRPDSKHYPFVQKRDQNFRKRIRGKYEEKE